jgi:hypothetical protein
MLSMFSLVSNAMEKDSKDPDAIPPEFLWLREQPEFKDLKESEEIQKERVKKFWSTDIEAKLVNLVQSKTVEDTEKLVSAFFMETKEHWQKESKSELNTALDLFVTMSFMQERLFNILQFRRLASDYGLGGCSGLPADLLVRDEPSLIEQFQQISKFYLQNLSNDLKSIFEQRTNV